MKFIYVNRGRELFLSIKQKAGIIQREPSAVAIKTIKKLFILHGSTMSTRA